MPAPNRIDEPSQRLSQDVQLSAGSPRSESPRVNKRDYLAHGVSLWSSFGDNKGMGKGKEIAAPNGSTTEKHNSGSGTEMVDEIY